MYEFLIVIVLIVTLMGLAIGSILVALIEWACSPNQRWFETTIHRDMYNLRLPRFTTFAGREGIEGIGEKSHGGLKAKWTVKT